MTFRLCLRGTLALLALVLLVVALAEPAIAQLSPRGPFGLGDGRPVAPPSGFVGWMLMKQAEFHRALIAAFQSARSGGGAGFLLGAGFAYGLFHAAGPGHGKAVVSAYVFANEQAVRRGVAIAVIAAFIQAVVAIALVYGALGLFGLATRDIGAVVGAVEIASFSLIVVLGLLLTWRKAKALYAALSPQGAAVCEDCRPLRMTYRPSSGGPAIGAEASAAPCGHVVIPPAAAVSGEKSWRDLAAVALAAGARPCSGAILLLALATATGAYALGVMAVFAMAAGTALATALFALGAGGAKSLAARAADRAEKLRPLVAGLELLAALAIVALGAALLAGYLSGA